MRALIRRRRASRRCRARARQRWPGSAAGSRRVLPDGHVECFAGKGHPREAGAVGGHRPGITVQQCIGDRLAGHAAGTQTMQDRLGEACAAANSGSECSGLRSPHSRYSSACCGKIGISTSTSGAPGRVWHLTMTAGAIRRIRLHRGRSWTASGSKAGSRPLWSPASRSGSLRP